LSSGGWFLALTLPAVLFSFWTQWRMRSVFRRYGRRANARGLSGSQAAAILLRERLLSEVKVEEGAIRSAGQYDPRTRTITLTPAVFRSTSIAAAGIACHEVGHALQHAEGTVLHRLRLRLVPLANRGWVAGSLMVLAGLVMASRATVLAGASLFLFVLLFHLVNLPFEFDASARAKRLAAEHGLLLEQEKAGMDRVLDAAALSYLAQFAMAPLHLLLTAGGAGFGRGEKDEENEKKARS
jgi:Zn-dependent membrane protease YugP